MAVSVPTFALTFDTELVWGSFDHLSAARFEGTYPDIRGTVESIINLLERNEISATWAVLGHLFLDRCERDSNGIAHPELAATRQSHWNGDWYSADPCSNLASDPLWYGPDVVDMIEAASTFQEIGCHSFGHAVYGDPAFTRAAADADLEACLALARKRGLTLRSFVFPRNVEGHLEALRDHGFVAFRGAGPIDGRPLPRPLRRARQFLAHLGGVASPASVPTECLPGLWDIQGSMLIMSRVGPRRLISRAARHRSARAGLAAALANGGTFHLWTHPFNLTSDPEYLLGWLEDVIVDAVRMRDRGHLTIETMSQIAERCSVAKAGDHGPAEQAPPPVPADGASLNSQ